MLENNNTYLFLDIDGVLTTPRQRLYSNQDKSQLMLHNVCSASDKVSIIIVILISNIALIFSSLDEKQSQLNILSIAF